jgi:hypothetical protein
MSREPMNTNRFLAIVSILIILLALPLALHSLHECLEKGGRACPCMIGPLNKSLQGRCPPSATADSMRDRPFPFGPK